MYSFFDSYFSTPLMALEFLVFGFFFAYRLKRQPYFHLRFFGLGTLEVAFVILIEILASIITKGNFRYGQQTNYDWRFTLFRFFFFLAIYAATFLVLKVSYKERVSTIFLVSASAFSCQHIAFNVFSLLSLPLNLIEEETTKDWIRLSIREACMLLTSAIIVIRSVKDTERSNPYEGNARKKVLISSIVILICIGLYRVNRDFPSPNIITSIGFSLYAIISCSLLLLLFFGLLESDKTHAEAEAYRELLRTQKAQYELSKHNIDLINEKCHDLKHQIHALKTKENEEFVKEIEHEIMIYDSSVKTGNEVLDVILREKLLQCEDEGIAMTCFLEGKAISFMDEMDIYSLFGNLLSNAYESVQKLDDKAKRTIALSGRNVGNMFFLHEENFCAENPQFEQGLPKTTKDNRDLHGFGMKSMQRIAEKYGGEMAAKCVDGVFSIDFVFPLNPLS